MKKKDRSYWIILILLFIIFIASILLYRNMNEGASGNNNTVIGVLTFKNRTIERKYDSDVIWEKAESGIEIRNKDTIRSEDFSDALLTLSDKTKININENSMIYLDMSEGDINLNFAYGSMSLAQRSDGGNSDLTIKIKSGQNTVEVKNSAVVLEKKGKEELSFLVKEGTAKIKNGKEEKELKANETAKLNNSEIEISEVNLNLLTPADGSIFSEKSDTIPVNFSWSSKNANKLKLEIAFDSRFKNIYKTYSVNEDSFQTKLAGGNYYWRISSETSKNKKKSIREYSSFRKFVVNSVFPPTLLSPKNNQMFSYITATPIIPFSWQRRDTARSYKLEISKNANFTEVIKSATTSQLSIGIDKLDPGNYFARVLIEPIREEYKTEPSHVVPFSIEKKKELESPVLVNQGKAEEISATAFAKSGYTFQVKDSPEIAKYVLEISSDSKFTNIIKEETSNTNQIKVNSKLEKGDYYWRVHGKTEDGKKTPPSATGKFSLKDNQPIELLSPGNNASLELNKNPIFFQWKRITYKAKFLFEISDSSDFTKKIHSAKTDDYSQSFSITQEGKYYWRVLSLGEDDAVLAKSPTHVFQTYEKVELIPIYPSKNEKVDMTPLNSINFKWEKNPNATSFLFELYREKSGSKKLITKAKVNNAYNFTFRDLKKLDEGNFLWTLQESTEGEEKGEKISVPFKIFLSTKPEAPKIKTPEKMYVE